LGELTVYNKINCLLVSVKGYLHCTSKIKFERLNISGRVEIEGVLDGLEIYINSDMTSVAKNISADVVRQPCTFFTKNIRLNINIICLFFAIV